MVCVASSLVGERIRPRAPIWEERKREKEREREEEEGEKCFDIHYLTTTAAVILKWC